MTEPDDAARREIVARLAESREELRQLLDPVRPEAHGEGESAAGADGFPRSRTMRMLLSGRGVGALAAVAGGLFIARPALAVRLIRMVPASAVARWALVRAVTAFRGRGHNKAAGHKMNGADPLNDAGPTTAASAAAAPGGDPQEGSVNPK